MVGYRIYEYMSEKSMDTELIEILTMDEDNFALAVVEYGGNLTLAYKATFGEHATAPRAKAYELMKKPCVRARIDELRGCVQETMLVSMSCHLTELANIRDLAKAQGAVKVALEAEVQRGKVAGYYIGKDGSARPPGEVPPVAGDHLEKLAGRITSLMRDKRSENTYVEDAKIIERAGN